MKNNFFAGENGLRDYLEPTFEKMIPLVELPPSLNPFFEKYDIHISAKIMGSLPLMNVKSLPAWNMMKQIREGSPNGDISVVESSSGNTVSSMGLFADSFGISRVKAIVSNDVTPDKLAFLRLAGLDIEFVDGEICPDPRDPNSSINIAKKQGEKSGWVNPNQYSNIKNPLAHTEITGPQIEKQVGENLAFFSAGLGTTGTFTGTAGYLKRKFPQLITVAAVRKPNNPVPGVRTFNQLAEIDFRWQDLVSFENIFRISEKKSFELSLKMIRKGLLVGPSSGFALAALFEKLESLEESGEIEKFRGKHAVFICPDSPLLYVGQYFDVLGEEYFGETLGLENLEKTAQVLSKEGFNFEIEDYEISPIELFEKVKNSDENFEIIDLRSSREFEDFHLENSYNIPIERLEDSLQKFNTKTELFFVCPRGSISLRAVKIARDNGFENSKSLRGGLIGWSDLGLPRVKNQICIRDIDSKNHPN